MVKLDTRVVGWDVGVGWGEKQGNERKRSAHACVSWKAGSAFEAVPFVFTRHPGETGAVGTGERSTAIPRTVTCVKSCNLRKHYEMLCKKMKSIKYFSKFKHVPLHITNTCSACRELFQY